MARRLALIGAVVAAAIGSPTSVSASASGSSDGADACASVPLGTLTFACGGLCNAAASCVLQDTSARSPCSLLSASIEVGETKSCTTAPSGACRAVCFADQRASATTFTFYVAFNSSTDDYSSASSSRSSDGSGSSAALPFPTARVQDTPSEVPFESNRIVRRIGELALPSTTTNVVISGGRTQDGTGGVVVDLKLDAAMFRQVPQVTSVSLLNMDLRMQDVAALLPFTLQALDLRNTKLQQLPQAISSFTQLETLVLDMNDLTDVPSTMKLPTLQTLRLRDNALTAFNAVLPSLHTLDLSRNRLQVFPYAVLASPTLRSLRIAGNPTMRAVIFSESQFTRLASLDELTIDTRVLDTSGCLSTQLRPLPAIGASVCVVPDSEWTAGGVLRKEAQRSSRDLDPELEEKITGAAQDRSSSHTTRTIVIVVLVALVLVAAMVAIIYVLWKRQRRLEADEAKAVINSRATDSATGEFERMRDNDDDVVGTKPSPPRPPRRLESCDSDASCVSHPQYSVNKDPELVAHRIRNELIEDVRVIGSGGFAVVWLVTYTPQSRPLAAKRLLSDHATRTQTLDFVLEIKLHLRLVHPSIVECVGVAWTTTASDLQVLFEYMPHGDLRSHLQSTDPGRWPWGYDKLRIAIDVIEALVYVHSFSPPLVHRDLKSRNVLLADEMKAKLCDFGVSRFASGDRNTGMATAMGTAKWLAPEVIAGRHDYDEACDLYAFGMILSELDTHQLPFDDAVGPHGDRLSAAAVLQLVACGKLQPTLSVTCPDEIRGLALQCLAFDPADRPSAIGVAYALRRLRNDWFKHKKLFRAD